MPELPEIEHLRRVLAPRLRGATLLDADLRRAEMWRNGATAGDGADAVTRAELLRRRLRGARVVALRRHGKQLAVETTRGTLCFHLGMSGQLLLAPSQEALPRKDHLHLLVPVRLRSSGPGRARASDRDAVLVLRDPRRFGGFWLYDSLASLRRERWSLLGPDALRCTAEALHERLRGSRRPLKAALLDQSVIAGLGNIYVDELLHAAGLHPLHPAHALDLRACRRLQTLLGPLLRAAVRGGGSTIRDYRDSRGAPGRFARRHCVYGRGGRPCRRCGAILKTLVAAGRTTVFCPRCQPCPPAVQRRG